jgi:nucleoside-diphosphate-sugar epimerase
MTEVADRIIGLTGAAIEVTRGVQRDGHSDLEHLEGSTKHALASISWESEISLDDGLSRTVDWHRSRRAPGLAAESATTMRGPAS